MKSSIFEIFGLQPSLDIHQEKLDKQYAMLIAATHPDKFTQSIMKDIAENNTAEINLAYKILSSPLKLYEYMIDTIQDDEAVLVDDQYILDTLILYEELNNITTYEICNTFLEKILELYNTALMITKTNIMNNNIIQAKSSLQRAKLLAKLLHTSKQKLFNLTSPV